MTDMLARLPQGNPGYDIVVPTDVTIYLLVTEALLEPVNLTRIPNIANIDPAFLNLGFDPDKSVSVPYQRGTVGIGYDTTRVEGEVTS